MINGGQVAVQASELERGACLIDFPDGSVCDIVVFSGNSCIQVFRTGILSNWWRSRAAVDRDINHYGLFQQIGGRVRPGHAVEDPDKLQVDRPVIACV